MHFYRCAISIFFAGAKDPLAMVATQVFQLVVFTQSRIHWSTICNHYAGTSTFCLSAHDDDDNDDDEDENDDDDENEDDSSDDDVVDDDDENDDDDNDDDLHVSKTTLIPWTASVHIFKER